MRSPTGPDVREDRQVSTIEHPVRPNLEPSAPDPKGSAPTVRAVTRH